MARHGPLEPGMEVRLLPPEPAHRTSSGRYLPKVENPRKRPHLSPAQVTELAEEVHPDFPAIVLSMGVLGLRPSEAIALREGPGPRQGRPARP
jgi:integrase